MTRYGYHASHEQHRPAALLEYVRAADAAGFEGAMCSDHFHPWLNEEGQSGFAWSWLGAALQATSLTFGTVSAPGWRYHPAVLAQAAATLADMYPRRLWLAIGSGEALNEAITGLPWPERAERNARLAECATILRALWAGETVTHRGRVTVVEATLFTRPAVPPLLYGAALTEGTAELVGGWADGLMTIGGDPESVERVIAAFRRGGGKGKPVRVQHALSFARTEEDARRGALTQWRFSALGPELLADLRTPAQFAAATRFVTEQDMEKVVRISADPARHAAWLRAYAELGVDDVHCFNVHPDQRGFIDAFGAYVLPQLHDA